MQVQRFRRQSVRRSVTAVEESLGPEPRVLSTQLVPARGRRRLEGRCEVEVTASLAAVMSGSRLEEPSDRPVLPLASPAAAPAGTAGSRKIVARTAADPDPAVVGRLLDEADVRLGIQVERRTDRDALVLQHVSLVKALAQRLVQRLPPQVELTDLVSVGVLGLIDAATRYKPSTGVPFDAFARRRVQGAMLDALRDLDWAPRSLRKMRRDLDTAIGKLRHELKREPEDLEIAAAMNLSEVEYDRLVDHVKSLELGACRQLNATSPEGVPLLELVIDPDEGPDARLERTELREHLSRALMELADRERQILTLYYEEELTMAEIGAVIGVCESRVSQLRSLAISRLRASLRQSLGRTVLRIFSDPRDKPLALRRRRRGNVARPAPLPAETVLAA